MGKSVHFGFVLTYVQVRHRSTGSHDQSPSFSFVLPHKGPGRRRQIQAYAVVSVASDALLIDRWCGLTAGAAAALLLLHCRSDQQTYDSCRKYKDLGVGISNSMVLVLP